MKGWIQAARPRTLPLAFSAITTGACDAFPESFWRHEVYHLALLTALLLQIVSNLANDYGDFKKGVDNPTRVGPARALQRGLLTPARLRQGIFWTGAAAFLTGIVLLIKAYATVGVAVLFFLAAGVAALGAALAYTLGRKPYGYRGFGELAAFIFFGPLAVSGTFFLLTAGWEIHNLLHGVAVGSWTAAVLLTNNIRDMAGDMAHGKRTLAVRLGSPGSRILLAAFLALGAAGYVPEGAWPLTLFATFGALPLIAMALLTPAPQLDRLLRLIVLYIIFCTVLKVVLMA